MGHSRTTKTIVVVLITSWILGLITSPVFLFPTPNNDDNQPQYLSAPMGLSAQLLYPNIGHAAIILNGSQVEVEIRGPSNISSWDFTIYHEYHSYSLAYDTPSYNGTTNIWSINVSIPNNAGWELYDLQVSVSDGLTQLNLEEWNAIQVRHSYPENFTIVQATDTHFFASFGSNVNKLRATQYQAALADADLIILTGDLTDDGAIGSFGNLRSIMRESRVPYLITPGNHDRDDSGPTFQTYKSIFGTDYYTVNLGPDILIIMANTYQPTGERYRFNFTQLSWIERDLAASSAKTKILAGHAPMFYPDVDGYFMQYDEAMELQRIAREQNLSVYLSGHLHNDRVDLINDTYFILTTSNGGSVWTNPSDPGHHRNGLRRLIFTNNNLTSWSWTNWNWSQPWDEVKVDRQLTNFYDQDLGGYLSVINNLTTPLTNQVVDFLVEPLSGPNVYHVDGASVAYTVNGTSAWFIRSIVDVPVDGIATVRVYPSNAQAPSIDSISYPTPGLVGSVSQIIAEVTNPVSGVERVEVNLSLDSAPYSLERMGRLGNDRFRYYRFFSTRTTLDFTVSASDYSGQTVQSSYHSFVVTNQPSPPILANPGDLSATGNVSLGWTSCIDDDGTIDHFLVQVSDTSDFTSIYYEENVTGTSTTIYSLTNNTYHFRVQSVDNDNAGSIWSNTQNITVAIPQPPTTPPPPPPPLPIDPMLIALIAGGVVIVVIIGVAVYFVRFRSPKVE